MSKSPLLLIALACASSFATLGCMFLQRPVGNGGPSANSAPAEVEEPRHNGNANHGGSAAHAANNEPAAPAKMIPLTIEVHSDCSKTVPVFYGDGKPGFSSGRKSSISSNSISSEARKTDGTLTIWIIDEHENGLSNVQITPDNKRVTVNSDCKSFKAE
jgi:hypothetical protein